MTVSSVGLTVGIFCECSDILHYEVIVKDASVSGRCPVIAICSCSPMYPRPTMPIQPDFFSWMPNGTGEFSTDTPIPIIAIQPDFFSWMPNGTSKITSNNLMALKY